MAEVFVTGQWFHYARLPEHDKQLYMQIYNALKQRKSDVTFPVYAHEGAYPSEERILEIFLHVIWDHPCMYFIDGTNLSMCCETVHQGKIRMRYTEYFDPQLSKQVEQVLRMRTDAILEQLPLQADTYTKLCCLYRCLIANVRYMDDITPRNSLKNLEARTIVGPLLNHLGVCAGYTKTFKLLCDQLNIGCFYIRGMALGEYGWANHGWNVVYLDGKFYHVDVTFEVTGGTSENAATWLYFLKSDSSMQKNHRWDGSYFPVILEDYSK